MRYVIDDRERNLFQVNREAFTSQEILEQERAQIFDKTWIYVGHESELPNKNDFHTREVAGRPVIFCRDQAGNFPSGGRGEPEAERTEQGEEDGQE